MLVVWGGLDCGGVGSCQDTGKVRAPFPCHLGGGLDPATRQRTTSPTIHGNPFGGILGKAKDKAVKRTPELPEWVTSFTDSQRTCKNVYELIPDETKLFGTEALVDEGGIEESTWKYGDWDADLLLLAQDAANANKIEQRIEAEHPDPFCALDWRGFSDGMETNRNLHWLAQQVG